MKNGGVGSVWRMVKSDRLGWGSRPVGNRFALRVLFVTLLALASGVPPSFAMEWNCARSVGDFRRSTDCTMTDEIDVSGDLTVTGQETVYSTLTAASGKRHFRISSGAHTLRLKWLNMTGGNAGQSYGGSIFVYSVSATLNVSHCVFFNNRANFGGAIFLPIGSVFSSTHSSFIKNSAGARGGAIYAQGNSGTGTPTQLHLTRVELTENKQTNASTSFYYGGGGLYLSGHVTANIRECLFVNNEATGQLSAEKHGGQIMTLINSYGTPSITVVNTKFTNLPGVNPFFGLDRFFGSNGVQLQFGSGVYVKPTDCTLNPCSAPPFTGDCLSSIDPNQGVICDPPACPTGSYNQFLSTPLPPPLAMPCGETMPEFSCSKLPTRGVYQRPQDCTLEGEVHVSGDLSVSGQETVYSTLTAKSGARHFRITSGAHTLRLKWLRMTGGDVSDYGGSIYVLNVNAILNISHCVFSSNHAAYGGAVFALL